MRRSLSLLLAIVVTTTLTGCIPTFEGAPGAPRVGVVSDSVLGMVESPMTGDLRQDHQVSFSRINAAKVFELWPTGDEYASTNPDTVIISAGTNDNFGRVDAATTIRDLQHMVAKFPGSCVTLMTLNTNVLDADVAARARQVNSWIRTQSRVADWDAWMSDYIAAGQPYGPLTYDLIHVTDQGAPFLTSVIDTATRRCLNRGWPFGNIDVASSPSTGTLHAAGWALDSDSNAAITMHVYVDGVFKTAMSANDIRNDVAAVYPFGSRHGFSVDVTGLSPGRHTTCIWALNVGTNGGGNSEIGCRGVTVT